MDGTSPSRSAATPAAPDALDAAAREAFARLRRCVADTGGLVVCLSGGVDSSLLAAVAHDVLGARAVALTGTGPSLAHSERLEAERVARHIGIAHVCAPAGEMDVEDYRRNGPDRCYHCKAALFRLAWRLAEQRGLSAVAEGSNADDLGDHRPGLRAAAEYGVRSPLAEVGLRKAQVRQLARALGLPVWDRPAMPCLSSRLPYGTPVTPRRLQQVEACERALRSAGLWPARARHHGDVVRIEVPLACLPRLLEAEVRARVVAACREAGFLHVAVDLEGLRSGSLNRVLSPSARQLACVPIDVLRRRGAS